MPVYGLKTVVANAYPRSRKAAVGSEAPAIPQDMQEVRGQEPYLLGEVQKVPEQGAATKAARAEALSLSFLTHP